MTSTAATVVATNFAEICSAIAALGCVFLLAAVVLTLRLRRWPASKTQARPSVSILKPLYDDEPGLLDRLLSYCDQDYRGTVEIVFGVQDAADPAIATVEALRVIRPHAAIDLVVDRRIHGSNRKVSNLINIADRARHDVFVIADSDIEVRSDYLERLTDALASPGVGAVTCLYHGEAPSILGATLSALAINAHFLPGVIVGMAMGAARPCFGSTIAIRRATLNAIGGFKRVANQLADDYAIGDAVRTTGLRVVVPDYIVSHACAEPDLRSFFSHQLRCARTVRSIDPAGYLGSLIANPFPLAIIGALSGAGLSIVLPFVTITCRLLLFWSIQRRFNLSLQRWWLLPIADLALFFVFCVSFFGSAVTWRGHRFRVLSDGTFSQTKT